MLRGINFIAQFLIGAGLLTGGQVFGATRLESLTVGYSNITATYAPLWIAVEERVGIKTDKAKALAALRLYMKGADEGILEESYQHTRGTIEDAPHPSLQVVKAGLEMLSLQYPQAKQIDASLIIEPVFMKRIDESGFVRALYKK